MVLLFSFYYFYRPALFKHSKPISTISPYPMNFTFSLLHTTRSIPPPATATAIKQLLILLACEEGRGCGGGCKFVSREVSCWAPISVKVGQLSQQQHLLQGYSSAPPLPTPHGKVQRFFYFGKMKKSLAFLLSSFAEF